MRYIVDIKNDTPNEKIDAWATQNNYKITHTFNHFEKLYLVDTNDPINLPDFVDHCLLDDQSTAVKLHMAPDTFTLNSEADEEWWKAVVIYEALENPTAEVLRRGEGYAVYLMDSGVNDSHEDFVDAKVRHLFTHTEDYIDNNGHGTALASIISGKRAGISSAEIVSVKIFEKGTPTLVSDILRALDKIALDYLNNYVGKPAIINMSWSIDKNEFVEDKIRSLIKIGLLVVAAAGNSGISIENVTPASMPEVATIGSIGTTLEPSNFSDYTGSSSISYTAGETNYAPGLDYWAPGESIYAAALGGGFAYIAGTSAAAAITTATLLYHFSKISLEYGKIYPTGYLGFEDQMEESAYIEATIDSLSNELVIPTGGNPFLPSRAIVDLSEKYINCTNRVPLAVGIYTDNLNADNNWISTSVVVKKDYEVRYFVFDHHYVDSVSIADLPAGLTLEPNGYLTGMMTQEVGDNKYKLFATTITLTRGDLTVVHPFHIIYIDMSVITDDFTAVDYSNLLGSDTGIQLLAGTCYRCPPAPAFGCPSTCWACIFCPDGKNTGDQCSPINIC